MTEAARREQEQLYQQQIAEKKMAEHKAKKHQQWEAEMQREKQMNLSMNNGR